ncbi:hypothetical protein EYC84_003069 [Monilinia fructicola]|uniref:Uncharacterized protein n=1 Tax=Monilinia fructicola TaxID=38448 RepID=A0A5M9JWG5_MONFR|nr:hypothetical protein EYC84_003069 [Monilinia fructicola]
MAPKESRRKSLSLFPEHRFSNLAHINTDVNNGSTGEKEQKDKKKPGKRTSLFSGLAAPTTHTDVDNGSNNPVKSDAHSPKLRPRTLAFQKADQPQSLVP